ncbi:MAG: TPM domain-containing protein [Clostridia bacterium]|nr:TPM domain-containing protein [Clostridia bacterium]
MKRIFSVLLIALLLVLPVLTAQAEDGQYVYADDGIFTADELQSINARAAEIAHNRGVGIYYFFLSDVEDVSSFIEEFASEHVVEENALVLGIGAEYRDFLPVGPIAKAVFSDDVCEGIYDAYNAVKGDPERKLLTYLNEADSALEAYFNGENATTASGEADTWEAPSYIARTDGGKPTLVDKEHLLSDSRAETLSARLREIGSTYKCDVVIVTVPTLGSKTAEEYADDYFDYNGYGYGATPNAQGTTVDGDGILLLLSMEDRDYWISTSGYAIRAFTDYGIQTYLEEQFLPYLRSNDYAGGFNVFADSCEYLLKTARESVPFDYRRVYIDGWSDAQLLSYNDRAESVVNQYDVGIYFLENLAVTNADAFCADYIEHRTFEVNSIVLVHGANGFSIRTAGAVANAKFTNEVLNDVGNAVEPYLSAGDTRGALAAYMDKCIAIVSDYGHVLVNGALSDEAQSADNLRLKKLFEEHGVGLYFLYDANANDPQALAADYLSSGAVYEGNAVVIGTNANGSGVAVRGDVAKEKFTDKRIKKLIKEVDACLSDGSVDGAVNAFAERSESILNWRPVNWITLAISTIAGLLFGTAPANALKRQLTSVSKQTNAEGYLEPDSFVMTQNSNVLLGKNTSRTVHVVRTESSDGPRGGSFGGGFHGGSSTHTSSSGGTHGGHGGKF